MTRRVLLIEPNYRNKYPPMGLMKLAMYHRQQGDEVVFYKGELTEFVLNELTNDAIEKFLDLDGNVDWRRVTPDIKSFIQFGKIPTDSNVEELLQRPFIMKWLSHFRKAFRTGAYYKSPRWDRVCVTTLFTFHWDITIKTIEFAKKVCKNPEQVMVGGILASVVPDEVRKATGITPHVGCLHVKRLFEDKPIDTTIDELPLDYSILHEIDYQYPAKDAFYAYTTRGCVNKCAFCAVPTLEPDFIDYIPLKKRFKKTAELFGEQRHLLLLDNNVFASPRFDTIIKSIRNLGFSKKATFITPNQLDIAVSRLRDGWNDRAYVRLAVKLLNSYVNKLEGDLHDLYYTVLMNNGLLYDYTATKESVYAAYEKIKDDYEKMRYKKPVLRFIDFNQGMDARLATSERMEKLGTIAIRPLRIAFDSWSQRKHYANAVRLAKENDITQMSNYLLYNFNDKPVDLYKRLLFNIELCEQYDVTIYSFPMKYHPITDKKWFTNRDYIGKFWTRKAIRTVQSIMNSTMGKIGRGRAFFFKAFGRNEVEFDELIMMPENFIIKRWDAELSGLTDKWRTAYAGLDADERNFVDGIVSRNIFMPSDWGKYTIAVRKFLNFYLININEIPTIDKDKKAQHIKSYEEKHRYENT